MLKHFSIELLPTEQYDKHAKRLLKLFEKGYPKFNNRYDDSEIIFREEDTEEISKYLNFDISKTSHEVRTFLLSCNDKEFMIKGSACLEKCINYLYENFSQYEDRVVNSSNYNNEIHKLVHEQLVTMNFTITSTEVLNFINKEISLNELIKNEGINETDFLVDNDKINISIGASFEDDDDGEEVYIYNVFVNGEYINIGNIGNNEDIIPISVIEEIRDQINYFMNR